ncbi:MAG: TRAP transporter small permease [Anaerovoracaceae bacterium]|jgi:TRAP-type C4-dicarboxylate transport system permease small subunit
MKKIMAISLGVGKAASWVSIAALIVMIFVTLADIFMSNLFSKPITGAIEIVRMMMVCMSPAFITALFQERHVQVGLFIDNLSRKAQLAFDTFGYVLTAILCAIMCYQGLMDMSTKMAQNQSYTMLKIPTWPFYALFAVSMGLLAIGIIVKLISHFHDKERYVAVRENGGEA